MAQELMDLAADTIKAARDAGADHARARIESGRSVEITYRGGQPETIKEASSRSLAVEVFAAGRYSIQSTSDLRPEAVKGFVANAVAATKLLSEDPYRTLPDPKWYEGRAAIDLKTVDPSYDRYTAEDRHALVKAVEAAALKHGGPKVISVEAQASDTFARSVMVASNGFQGEERQTSFLLAADMTLQDEGDRRPNGAGYAVGVDRASLPPAEAIGREAADRTLALLGAKKLPTETLPIIIENRIAARVLSGVGQAMSAAAIDQKRSFLADKKGKKVGSALFTVIDDPFIPGGLGSRHFDEDGIAARKRTIVEAGVLREFYVDWYYGRKLGWDPTTGSPSNLVLPPGTRSLAEIMKDLGRGILITNFIGGNSNSTTGDFSIGIVGRLFENGVPAQAVAEMNIADNHLKFWDRLVAVGNDPWLSSSQRFPSLVIDKVVVSGV